MTLAVEHLLLSLLRLENGMVPEILDRLPIDEIYLGLWWQLVTNVPDKNAKDDSPFALDLVRQAKWLALNQLRSFVRPKHLASAVLDLSPNIFGTLSTAQIQKIRLALEDRPAQNETIPESQEQVQHPHRFPAMTILLQAMRHAATCESRFRRIFPFGPLHVALAIKEASPELLPIDLREIRQQMELSHRHPIMQFIYRFKKA
jgi:hypothetical protein